MDKVPEHDLDALMASAEQFPTDARFARYQRVFCRRFADLAPEAWKALLTLKPLALTYLEQRPDSPEKYQEREVLFHAVDEWADRFGVTAWWIKEIGANTLIAYVQAEVLELDLPQSLVQALEGDIQTYETLDGKPLAVWRPVEVEPFAGFTFFPPSDPITWDPFQETKAQFRKRIEGRFTEWLRKAIDGATKLNPVSPEAPNAVWVEWLILRRAAGRSANSIAAQYRVKRYAVDNGIQEAAKALQMPDHSTTPERFKGANSNE